MQEPNSKVLCSHVLEHVDAEMHRILAANGVALLMTPIIEGWPDTYENPAIIDRTSEKYTSIRRIMFGIAARISVTAFGEQASRLRNYLRRIDKRKT
ncbi:hypothetical protein ABIC02_006724 [Bradyrhizobium sp. RT5a]